MGSSSQRDGGVFAPVLSDELAHRASILSIVARGSACPEEIAKVANLPLEETQVALVWLEHNKMIELFPAHGHAHARPTTGTKTLFRDARPKKTGL